MANGKPGRPKGLPKTGGKKRGTPNRETMSQAARNIESVELTVARVLQEYGHIAFLDIRDLFLPDGRLKALAEWPDAAARAVAGIEVEEANQSHGRIHKVKILNKQPALDSIAKHLGMFVERLEHSGEISIGLHTRSLMSPPQNE